MNFSTKWDDIEERLNQIDPIAYAETRNYGQGAITYLSPYISRGVLSTKDIYRHLLTLNLPWEKIEKLVQELAWRDYWQNIWVDKGDAIHDDLKNTQHPIANNQVPEAVLTASTGITLIDKAIKDLYDKGYMHNHMRMYIASICCNIANSHWLQPSKWMYAQLLDGDLASNQLSWQWVAGAFSNKKYYANQNNINKFFNGTQTNTFLNVEYNEFDHLEVPDILQATAPFELKTPLPEIEVPTLDPNKKTLLYNYYNLDPFWHKDDDLQRVILLEPSLFEKHPVNQNCIDFATGLSKNIKDAKIFIGEFEELTTQIDSSLVIYKEHPLNKHYQGLEEPRDWLSNVHGYYPSFFKFWKLCKKELNLN